MGWEAPGPTTSPTSYTILPHQAHARWLASHWEGSVSSCEVQARREVTLRSQVIYPPGPDCSAEFPGTLSLFQRLGCSPS